MSDETLRRSDELLTELIETVETARALPMSASCVLPREHLLDLLDELREVLPPEMDEARTVIARRERLLHDAYEQAAAIRQRAVDEADATLADSRHRADELVATAQREAQETAAAGRAEHARLVSATTVHQAAAAAAAALREDAENYQRQLAAEAQQYDGHVRGEADAYAQRLRGEAERYAARLTADAEDYADRTLDDLGTILRRAAHTAEQGRATLAQRRGGAFAESVPEPGGSPCRSRGNRRRAAPSAAATGAPTESTRPPRCPPERPPPPGIGRRQSVSVTLNDGLNPSGPTPPCLRTPHRQPGPAPRHHAAGTSSTCESSGAGRAHSGSIGGLFRRPQGSARMSSACRKAHRWHWISDSSR